MSKVLLVGESWVSVTTHYKGFDHFVSGGYDTGVAWFRKAMEGWIEWEHMPSHEAQTSFPTEIEDLNDTKAIIMSDVGADTFLLHPKTWLNGEKMPNRLKLIEEYVRKGGGLIMAGGYLSYQGINGAARYHNTPIERVLPVEIQPYDDRCECPEGIQPNIIDAKHALIEGLPEIWPHLLGYNKVKAKSEGKTIVKVGTDPLLVTGTYGKGRAIAWTSDIGPHWCPREFAEWDGYKTIWRRMLSWVSDHKL